MQVTSVAVLVGAGAISVAVAQLLRASPGVSPEHRARFWGLAAFAVALLAAYAGWVVCDLRGAVELRGAIAAGLLASGGLFCLMATLAVLRALAEAQAHARSLELKVAERTAAARHAADEALLNTQRLNAANLAAGAVAFERDLTSGRITWCSDGAERIFGFPLLSAPAEALAAIIERDDAPRLRDAYEALRAGRAETLQVELRAKDAQQRIRWFRVVGALDDLDRTLLRGAAFDVTESRRLEIELHQAQKLEAIGQLASGIAHEINTPIQFVGDNVAFIRDATDALLELVDGLTGLARTHGAQPQTLVELAERADLEFTRAEMPKAVAAAGEGLARVADIVRAMKDFSHSGGPGAQVADLNRALKSTLSVARNEYKYVADVETDFGDLPLVPCRVGDLSQVFLNLIVNAAHAIGDRRKLEGADAKGKIRVSTRRTPAEVLISIADDGAGIPPEVQPRIFEPFFTTKEVGRGTGQGLTISRNIVLKHGGKLWFETSVGQGTTFHLALPLDAGAARPPQAAP